MKFEGIVLSVMFIISLSDYNQGRLRKVSLAEAYKEYMLPKEIETDGEAKEKHAL